MTDDQTPEPQDAAEHAETEAPVPPSDHRRPQDDLPHQERRDVRVRELLQQAEAERDELRRMLTDRDRADAERLAADLLRNPADLWLLLGADDPAPLRDDAGRISAEVMADRLAEHLQARPYLRRPEHGVAINGDQGTRRVAPDQRQGPGWSDVLRR